MYGLIACSINKNWKLIGSDISVDNIEWSRKNIESNHLQENISGITTF